MGDVLVSLGAQDEALLRRLAREKYDGKKGSLSNVVSEAVNELAKKDKRSMAIKRQLALMKKGFDLGLKGGRAYKTRDEIYD